MNNKRAMDCAVQTALDALRASRPLTARDPGAYKTVKLYGPMRFHVEQYAMEGVGNLSVMRMKLGLMAMATVVVTPFQVNAPLMSVDFIYMMGARKAYIEFYDLVAEKDAAYQALLDRLTAEAEKYAALADLTPSPAWYDHLLTAKVYKSAKAAEDDVLLGLLRDLSAAYGESCAALPALTESQQAEKRRITAEYAEGLVEHGGVSTDVFKKRLGAATTRDFFARVFFGTQA